MKIIKQNWLTFNFLVSVVAISFALIAENIFNILPCKMCFNQRYPYYFIILFFLLTIFYKKISYLFIIAILEFVFLYGLFYSAWHFGIENKFLMPPEGCSNFIDFTKTNNEIKKQILNQTISNCDEVNWKILGVSAVLINLLLMTFLFIFNTILLIKAFNDKKK